MGITRARSRRGLWRAGPVLVALLLGVGLVGSSALSYRDAEMATAAVSERQGIGFLHRLDRLLLHRSGFDPAELRRLWRPIAGSGSHT